MEKYKDWKTVFTFKIEELNPLSMSTKDLDGKSKWFLRASFVKALKGHVLATPGDIFSLETEIYVGPVLSRPSNFWVFTASDQMPKKGQVWIALGRDEKQDVPPQDWIAGKVGFCIGELDEIDFKF